MWRLSIVPTAESGLPSADVVVHAEPDATVADLARGLAGHLGSSSALLLAPVTDGTPWPAGRRLADAALRSGDVLSVASVPRSWLRAPGARRRRTAVVRVVAGPDTGLVVAVDGDAFTIGRSTSATVTLTDPLVSRVHARVLLPGGAVLCDEGSAHGTRVAGREVGRPVPVAWGERVEVGDSGLVLEPGDDAGADGAGREVAVLRPPRFGESLEAAELDVPAPPQQPRRQPLPWAMLVMPVVIGAGMLMMSRSRYALVFVIGWPIAMLATHLANRRQQKKEYEAELAAWRTELQEVLDALDSSAAVQRAHAEDDDPDLDLVRSRVVSRDRRLWSRSPQDDDFGVVRVGRGPQPAVVTGKVSRGGDREQLVAARGEVEQRASLAGMPVGLELLQHGLVAVTGAQPLLDGSVRAVLLRLAAGHSPAEVQVAAVLGHGREHLESWLRWLPHTAPRLGAVPPVAVGAADGMALLDLLAAGGGRGRTLCVVDEGAGLPRRAVEAAATHAEDGLHLLWVGDDPDRVPAATAVHVDLAARRVERASRGGRTPLEVVDALDLVPAWQAARRMTGYLDQAALVPPDSALPEQVRLPELGADLVDVDDPTTLLSRWSSSRGLRAQIGAGADGVVTIDLREDGPHGLVAGTTGSGKSELLQTLICSLAVNNPPTRITFLLVDYKGGAAFRECADLPHTVGYITDLTPALVQRALVSLHAELTTREGLLATYGAKDLVALERDHPEAAPPSLLICVDEFAALTAEVPEFVDGMVSIAQRGRSLGMHMLLATQRPAGVVTPQIKANTDLRIALRVSSPDDSTDVIDTADAAQLSRRTPGRAWVRRTGHGTSELVQGAWVGARERLRDAAASVEIEPFSARDLSGGSGGSGPAAGADARFHARSDLDRLVATAAEAFGRSGLPVPRRPWLPALPTELLLACRDAGELVVGQEAADEVLVPGSGGHDVHRLDGAALGHDGGDLTAPFDSGRVLLGLLDRPAQQTQQPLVVDYARVGHLLVYGTSGSGKTELLRTMAAAVTGACPSTPAVVYGIDCGGGGLGVLETLPSVGSIVVEAQLERVLRMIRMLHRTVRDRNAALAAAGVADLASLAAAGSPLPRLHLLVDNLPALLDALEGGGTVRRAHVDQLLAVLQEGRRAGVHVTATSPRRVGVPTALASAFGQRLVLRMTVADDYAMLGVAEGVLDAQTAPGRGLSEAGEVQVATLGGDGGPGLSARLTALADVVRPRYAERPSVAVPGMPGALPTTLVPRARRSEVCLGVEAEYASAVTLDLLDGPLLVTGRSGTGRTSLLRGVAELATGAHVPAAQVVVLGPRSASWVPGRDGDLVIDDPQTAAAWLADAVAAGPVAGEPDGWRLLLVDDAHVWERGWEAGGPVRELVAALATGVDALTAAGWAVVLATDPDDARTRQHVAGPVAAVRRHRRAVLLSPDMSDGSLAGVTVPMHTHEPVTGRGRGLLCASSSVRVVQVVCAAEAEGAVS